MHPVNLHGMNVDLVKPADMTDEQCTSMKALHDIDNDGFPFFLTAWMPNKEDLEALNAGRPLLVKVIGKTTPPIALWTYDENGECNSPR